MLTPPTKNFSRSVKTHNVDVAVLADWVEGSLLFGKEEAISKSDVVDMLIDEEIYEKSDFAWEIVVDGWNEIENRVKWVGDNRSVRVESNRIKKVSTWEEIPAHAFLLILSFTKWFPDWAESIDWDYNVQGDLFERVTEQAFKALFSDWETYRTGWTPADPANLSKIVERISGLLNEKVGDIGFWTNENANEAGLDLLCYRPFPDQRVSVPVYLFQCASGQDWRRKLHTPQLEIWKKVIIFAVDPKKAFSTPYAFLSEDFVRVANLVNGLLMDRYRILGASARNPNWLSDEVTERLVAWLRPHVDLLKWSN